MAKRGNTNEYPVLLFKNNHSAYHSGGSSNYWTTIKLFDTAGAVIGNNIISDE